MFRKLAIALLAIFVFTLPAFCEYPTMSFSNGGLGSSGGGSSEWTASGSTQIYTEKSVGIGTSTPDVNYLLSFDGSKSNIISIASGDRKLTLQISEGWTGGLDWVFTNSSGLSTRLGSVYGGLSCNGSGFFYSNLTANRFVFRFASGNSIYSPDSTHMSFSVNNVEAARFTDNQNLLLGTQTDDGINKLQVTGDSKFNGDLTASGTINLSNTPVYADNAAALAGGLVAGDVYRTSTGVLMITY